ncbi:MAG: WecB/TagA/CpsF family glycosyltransferase [Arcobacter sp.]|nr:WecB/TagA/CpsF family glycosyltransferase [Arcobacter sp.]
MAVQIEDYNIYTSNIENILIDDNKKTIINTINAHSYIVAKNDEKFQKALVKSDLLLPDGEGIVLMVAKLKNMKIKKIAGEDIHNYLLDVANDKGLKCFYLGATQHTLDLMKSKLSKLYPKVNFGFFSPPFKEEFSNDDNKKMIDKVNSFSPDILFVGMTAPKQEKWVYQNKEKIQSKVICSIGAVFDFVAETKKRAPQWIIDLKFEWMYRSFTAWRLTKRYLYSTPLFLIEIFKLKYFSKK